MSLPKVLIVTAGSMGDVRPYALLARALQDAGHAVILLTNPGYETLGQQLGLRDMRPFWLPLACMQQVQTRANDQTQAVFDSAFWQSWFDSYPTIWQTCCEAGVLLARNPMLRSFAALCGLPFILASNMPPPQLPRGLLPRVEAYTPLQALDRASRLQPYLRRAVYRATHLVGAALAPWQYRAELKNLPQLYAVGKRHQQALQQLAGVAPKNRPQPAQAHWIGLSAHLVPELAAHARFELTGLWYASDHAQDFQPPAELDDFLAAGPAPVYFGFGSNVCTRRGRDFDWVARQIASAIELAGCRAILQRGWGGLRWPAALSANDKVLQIDQMPHEYLFPRMALLVHHGGAGTALQAAHSGTPSLVVPFVQDQFFWAWRLRSLGLALPSVEADRLQPKRLAALLTHGLQDGALRHAAAVMGQKLRAEQGLQRAVALLQHFTTGKSSVQ